MGGYFEKQKVKYYLTDATVGISVFISLIKVLRNIGGDRIELMPSPLNFSRVSMS